MVALLATRNRGKLRELAPLFHGARLELRTPEEAGIAMPEVRETGVTFEENARLKARALAAASGMPSLADDSGLEVDALGGAPGVRSARYAGDGATDEANCRKLLAELESVPPPRRGRFRCVLVLARPTGELLTAEGILEGEIARAPAGESGFGYDPVFFLPQMGKTVAQIGFAEKQRISHRARAAARLVSLLPAFLR